METRNVEILIDENTGIGILEMSEGPYFQYDGGLYRGLISEEQVLKVYFDAGLRIPDSFVGLRNKIQALL